MSPDMKDNLKKLPTNYSTWAVGAVSTAATVWVTMPEADQKQILDNLLALFPWLKAWMGPISAAIVILVARVLPQPGRDNPPEPPKEPPSA
jgi:hypothetical protein